jgi:mono/diheme cytochrome c family protein
MKKIALTLTGIMTLAVGPFVSQLIANPSPDHDSLPANHHQQDPAGGGSAGADSSHMGQMNSQRQQLMERLGDEYRAPIAAATPVQLSKGKELFVQLCTICHGKGGQGDGPAAESFDKKPSNFTDPEHSKYYSDRARIAIITDGVAGSPMPAWKEELSVEEIMAVHSYIRSLRQAATDSGKGSGGHGH